MVSEWCQYATVSAPGISYSAHCAYPSRIERADERIRTADIISLRIGCDGVRVVPRRLQKPINTPISSCGEKREVRVAPLGVARVTASVAVTRVLGYGLKTQASDELSTIG